MGECWDATWCQLLQGYLSDQQVEEWMVLQQPLLHLCPVGGTPNGWSWTSMPFSMHSAYKRIRENQLSTGIDSHDALTLYGRRNPSPPPKSVHLWIVVGSELIDDHVTRQRLFLEAPAGCLMCSVGLEDCSHLFCECLVARAVWTAQNTIQTVASSAAVFWDSIWGGVPRQAAEGSRLLAVFWPT